MKKIIHWMLSAAIRPLVLTMVFCGATVLTACSNSDNSAQGVKGGADLVVYGKIFTSERLRVGDGTSGMGNQVVEAFAVKNGKYVYVGDKAGAEAYIEKGKTEVVDYTGKGLVMPGCGNGHAHYSSGFAIQTIGTFVGPEDDPQKFLIEILPAAVKKAKDKGIKAYIDVSTCEYGKNETEIYIKIPDKARGVTVEEISSETAVFTVK